MATLLANYLIHSILLYFTWPDRLFFCATMSLFLGWFSCIDATSSFSIFFSSSSSSATSFKRGSESAKWNGSVSCVSVTRIYSFALCPPGLFAYRERLTNCQWRTDWRTDLLTNWRTDGPTDWLTHQLTEWRTDGLTYSPTDEPKMCLHWWLKTYSRYFKFKVTEAYRWVDGGTNWWPVQWRNLRLKTKNSPILTFLFAL